MAGTLGSQESLQTIPLLENVQQEQQNKCCSSCRKPTYKPRRVKNKGALLVLTWNYLVMSEFYLLMKYNNIGYDAVWQLVGGFTLPVAGWLADIYIGRYKLLSASIWIMWFSTVAATISLTTAQLFDAYTQINAKMLIVIHAITAIGLCAFQAIIIQFGLDQLHDASTTEIKAFIIWHICTIFGCGVILDITLSCSSEQFETITLLLVCAHITIAVVLLIRFKHSPWLIKEPVSQSPFKLVYQVMKYAIKNKYPRQRSSFTYCEDGLPSRIDFGKNKYGGPFTTEQVEDVKTFLRLFPVAMLGGVLAGQFFLIKNVRHYILEQFIHFGQSEVVMADHLLSECYIELSFRHLFVYSAIWLIIVHETFLYPVFHRYYPQIKSSQKALIGMILQIISVMLPIVFEVYSRQAYLKHNSENTTIQCMFYKQESSLSVSFDYRWMVIPDFCTSLSVLMIGIGFLEFLSAQIPLQMKGIMLGTGYGVVFIAGVLSAVVMLPFKAKLSIWGMGIISCGFWYLLLALFVELSTCFALVVLMRRYKRRKREDVLPNEHYYAERYYSKY